MSCGDGRLQDWESRTLKNLRLIDLEIKTLKIMRLGNRNIRR